ncbi:MAG: protein translocase subunit SecD [Proteobacteria bacterium]|nr:protein translocase subunit SecD [Pseudomonadota bacterium]
MLSVPLWKKTAILFICLFGIYFSLPSIFPALLESKLAGLLPKTQVSLGLDLRGGSSLLLEVDVEEYRAAQVSNAKDQLLSELRKVGIHPQISMHDYGFSMEIQDRSKLIQAQGLVRDILGYKVAMTTSAHTISVTYETGPLREMTNGLMQQTLEIIHRRVDESGTKEIDLQRQGDSYILLQVPGVTDPKQLKEILGKTAKLSFHEVEERTGGKSGVSMPIGARLLPMLGEGGVNTGMIAVRSHPILTGEMLVDAQASVNHLGQPVVNFRFSNLGAKIFGDFTKESRGKHLAIVLDNKILSAPTINEPILGGSGVISGSFTVKTAGDLALLLRAGALPAPIKIVEERVVGPSLGKDSIQAGQKSVILGVVFVVLVMLLCYGLFGLFAVIAMVFNLFLMIGVLAFIGATLTLPSIAGMVLTLGMAVDANVLICERIREEMKIGKSNINAIESGYKMAFLTIFDSNITTIIAAMLLYMFGTGPIRGFAVSLTVGLLCSMFTAIALTKLMVIFWYRSCKPKTIPL